MWPGQLWLNRIVLRREGCGYLLVRLVRPPARFLGHWLEINVGISGDGIKVYIICLNVSYDRIRLRSENGEGDVVVGFHCLDP